MSGSASDPVEKFFRTSESAVLFPAYIGAAVEQGMQSRDILSAIVAAKTEIDSMDYRSILPLPDAADRTLADVAEGGFLPETEIRLKENLVHLRKRPDRSRPPTRPSASSAWTCLPWPCARSAPRSLELRWRTR